MTDLPSGCKFAPRCKYAQDLCYAEEPALIEAPTAVPARSGITDSIDDVESDPAAGVHLYRCFYPVGTPEAAEAFERNIASGRVSEAGVVIRAT